MLGAGGLCLLLWLASPTPSFAEDWDWTLVAEYPHDRAHFTQGLEMHDRRLFESVGGYGDSALYEKDLHSGRVLRRHLLGPEWFGEGLAIVGSRLFQLTWREQRVFLYDLQLTPLASLPLRGEGWGLTRLGEPERLIKSDGSSRLQVLDPADLKPLANIEVTESGRPLAMLNELEAVNGLVLANVWMTDRVVAIDPEGGEVVGNLNLATLRERIGQRGYRLQSQHVLNGIAYQPGTGRLLVTGKCWPSLFELEVIEGPLASQARAEREAARARTNP